MIAVGITISISITLLLLLRVVKKSRSKGESTLSILEHPSTFEKPTIEMVSTSTSRLSGTPSKVHDPPGSAQEEERK